MRRLPRVRRRRRSRSGSSIARPRPASTSCTSTACRASSTCRRSWPRRRALRLRQRRRSRRLPRAGSGSALDPAQTVRDGPLCIRNDLAVRPDGTRTLHFTDVTDAERHRRARLRHGRRDRRLRQRRLGRSLPHELRRANQLFRNNGDGTFTDVSKTSGTDAPVVERVGGVRRLRPRRLARSLRRQLPALLASRATRRALSPSGALDYCPPASYRAAARIACTATAATARSPTSPQRARIGARVRSGARRRRRPTSTATAGSTSTSPTTARRTSSGSTSATARSRTPRCSPAWRCR